MTKVEILTYEYQRCIDCHHCGLWHVDFKLHERVWSCNLTDKGLDCGRIMEFKIPKWCPLPTKE